eukprot:12897717-Prorocentrum_lima.AAC.1
MIDGGGDDRIGPRDRPSCDHLRHRVGLLFQHPSLRLRIYGGLMKLRLITLLPEEESFADLRIQGCVLRTFV